MLLISQTINHKQNKLYKYNNQNYLKENKLNEIMI